MPVAQWTATFRRDLKDSDALHWGEGTPSISPQAVSLVGKLAPGPDLFTCRPSLWRPRPTAPQTADAARGDVKTFSNLSSRCRRADLAKFNTVIVGGETFSEFITAAAVPVAALAAIASNAGVYWPICAMRAYNPASPPRAGR